MQTRLTIFVALVVVLLILGSQAFAAKRLALIVGNSKYEAIGPLKNAVSDASAISKSLKRLDFSVTLLKDPKSDDFWTELEKFNKKAESAESVLFFYSGHAFQLNGTNYLVPVNAQLQSAEAITTETWDLNNIIRQLQDRNRQTLIFLDACRNNPLPESARTTGAAANGLARLQTGTGTFVAFATEPGAVTFDGTGDNSPFTTSLLDNIETPGISISDMMIEVRNDVEEKTFRKQVPWDQSSLRSQFYFKEVREKQPGLTAGDFEMLASLPQEDREKMLKLLEASGISTKALEDVVVEASENLAIVQEDSGLIMDEEEPVLAEVEEEPVEETIEIAKVEEPVEEPEPVVDAEPLTEEDVAALETVDSGLEIFDTPDEPEVAVAAASEESTELEETIVTAAADPNVAQPPKVDGVDPLASPASKVADQEVEVIRLAALTSTTRSVPWFNLSRQVRLAGDEISVETEEGRDALGLIAPDLLQELTNPVTRTSKDLKRAVQAELKRLGCYRSSIDGDWGKGSRTALSRYFIVKKLVPDTLEPTEPLFHQLRLENNVVCEISVARLPANRAKVKEKSTGSGKRKSANTVAKKKKLKKGAISIGVFR